MSIVVVRVVRVVACGVVVVVVVVRATLLLTSDGVRSESHQRSKKNNEELCLCSFGISSVCHFLVAASETIIIIFYLMTHNE